jgi:hypothetical protein
MFIDSATKAIGTLVSMAFVLLFKFRESLQENIHQMIW